MAAWNSRDVGYEGAVVFRAEHYCVIIKAFHQDLLESYLHIILIDFRFQDPFLKKDNGFPNGITIGEARASKQMLMLSVAAMRFYAHLDSKHNPGPINY